MPKITTVSQDLANLNFRKKSYLFNAIYLGSSITFILLALCVRAYFNWPFFFFYSFVPIKLYTAFLFGSLVDTVALQFLQKWLNYENSFASRLAYASSVFVLTVPFSILIGIAHQHHSLHILAAIITISNVLSSLSPNHRKKSSTFITNCLNILISAISICLVEGLNLPPYIYSMLIIAIFALNSLLQFLDLKIEFLEENKEEVAVVNVILSYVNFIAFICFAFAMFPREGNLVIDQ